MVVSAVRPARQSMRAALIGSSPRWHARHVAAPTPASPASVSPLERALARERERTRTLREVGLLLDSTVPRDELLKRVLSAAARVTESERATLYLVDESGSKLVSQMMEGGEGTGRIVLT